MRRDISVFNLIKRNSHIEDILKYIITVSDYYKAHMDINVNIVVDNVTYHRIIVATINNDNKYKTYSHDERVGINTMCINTRFGKINCFDSHIPFVFFGSEDELKTILIEKILIEDKNENISLWG